MKNDFIHQGISFYRIIAFSAGIHLLFLFALMYGHLLPSRSIDYTPVYKVNLVSSASEAGGKPRAVEAVKTPPQIHAAVPKPAPRMILPIEKKAPSTSELLSAIKHVNSELKRQQMLQAIQDALKGENAPAATRSESSAGNQGSGKGMPSGHAADEYYSLIWQRIHDAWLVPSSMATASYGYETVVTITIQSNGNITDLEVEKSSGNIYFDQTALRAIKRASPLPPFPPSWLQKNINIGIKFSCKEGCK